MVRISGSPCAKVQSSVYLHCPASQYLQTMVLKLLFCRVSGLLAFFAFSFFRPSGTGCVSHFYVRLRPKLFFAVREVAQFTQWTDLLWG